MLTLFEGVTNNCRMRLAGYKQMAKNSNMVTGFGVHVAISGCRVLSQSIADTFFQLSVVANHRILF